MVNGEDALLKAREWLSKHGYPFEMQMAAILAKQKFSVTQSDYYLSGDNIPREIDITASRWVGQNESAFAFDILAECKNKPGVPFIAFLESDEYRSPRLIMHNSATKMDYEARNMAEFKDIKWWNGYGPYAYSITTAYKEDRNNGDIAYEACKKILQASYIKSKESPFLLEQKICFPMVITGGPLISASLGKSGEVKLKSEDFLVLNWRNIIDGERYHRVQLTTMAGLRKVSKKICAELDLMEIEINKNPKILLEEKK